MESWRAFRVSEKPQGTMHVPCLADEKKASMMQEQPVFGGGGRGSRPLGHENAVHRDRAVLSMIESLLLLSNLEGLSTRRVVQTCIVYDSSDFWKAARSQPGHQEREKPEF